MFDPGTDIAVMNGINFLNEHGPVEWWNRIDYDTLDMDTGFTCILGQDFEADAQMTGFTCGYFYAQHTWPELAADPIRHGFCAVDGVELRSEWIRSVENIREEIAA